MLVSAVSAKPPSVFTKCSRNRHVVVMSRIRRAGGNSGSASDGHGHGDSTHTSVNRVAARVLNSDITSGASRIYTPRNDKQRKYIELLEMERPCIVIGHGTAGTGKTKLAVEVGVQKLLNKEVERIIVTRPAVAVDEEQHGFLPGTLEQKMKPWLSPVLDTLGGHFSALQIERMIETRVLEIAPLTYMRGRTFENCWIVVDEAQNMTKSQMLMMLTRMGKGSKLVFTGDPCQHDRRYNRESGLIHFLELLEYEDLQHPDIRMVEFTDSDVQRHHMIPHILKMYNDGPALHDVITLASGRSHSHNP